MPAYSAILFDWDGTVADTREGIFNSVRYAVRELGIPEKPEAELQYFIGPPLYDGFEHVFGVSPELASVLTDTYRIYYSDRGIYESRLYDGVRDLLIALRAAGAKTAVVSSKPQEYLDVLVSYFDLTDCFDFVLGPEMNNHVSNKARLVTQAMDLLACRPEETAMIGDRKFDMAGAKDAGADAIGVLYGYGTAEELREYGADVLCEDVDALREALLS